MSNRLPTLQQLFCLRSSAGIKMFEFRKVNHSRPHSYWSCLCHLIFTAISGWCWRHCGDLESHLSVGTNSDPVSPPVFLIANGLFVYFTLHGALGVLRFGHPQLCLNPGFRKIYEVSFTLLRVLPCALITAQVYGFYWKHLDILDSYEQLTVIFLLLFSYNLSHFVLGCVILAILNELWKSSHFVKLFILFADVALLMLIGWLDESYWTIFLGIQILFCNFVLDFLSCRYEISFLEMFMIGLCFFNIFAFRSLVELIEVVLDNYAGRQS